MWIVTGDGDALSIGGNHLIHCLRRNLDVNILLFNNRIYGLTKGQYSPTSEIGKVTKSTPARLGRPPVQAPRRCALGAEATFVARSIDVEAKHLQDVIRRAARAPRARRSSRSSRTATSSTTARSRDVTESRHQGRSPAPPASTGKPMIFGKDRDKGIRMNGMRPEVVRLADASPDEILVHDTKNPVLAYLLGHMTPPDFPTPLGVIYDVDRPVYEDAVGDQMRKARASSDQDLCASPRERGHLDDPAELVAEPVERVGSAVARGDSIVRYALLVAGALCLSSAFLWEAAWPLAWIGFVPLIALAPRASDVRAGRTPRLAVRIRRRVPRFSLARPHHPRLRWLPGAARGRVLPDPHCLRCVSVRAVHRGPPLGRAEARAGSSLRSSGRRSRFLYPNLFPWRLGHSQRAVPLLMQIGDATGPYGLSFAMIYLAAALTRVREGSRALVGPLAVLALLIGYGIYREAQVDAIVRAAPAVRVGIVQGNLSLDEKRHADHFRENVARYQHLSSTITPPPDLLVWPESVVEWGIPHDEANLDELDPLPGATTPLIFGAVSYTTSPRFRAAPERQRGMVQQRVPPLGRGSPHRPLRQDDPHALRRVHPLRLDVPLAQGSGPEHRRTSPPAWARSPRG